MVPLEFLVAPNRETMSSEIATCESVIWTSTSYLGFLGNFESFQIISSEEYFEPPLLQTLKEHNRFLSLQFYQSIWQMSAFLVLYFFQGEPGESMESPNAFSVRHNQYDKFLTLFLPWIKTWILMKFIFLVEFPRSLGVQIRLLILVSF